MVNNSLQYKLFARFLKERKCYYRFKTERDKSSTIKRAMLDDPYPYSFFVTAFDWEDTPQGSEFWSRLQEQWFQTLKYNRNNAEPQPIP